MVVTQMLLVLVTHSSPPNVGGGGGGDALKAQERLRRSQSVWRVLPPLKKGFNTENMAYYAGA